MELNHSAAVVRDFIRTINSHLVEKLLQTLTDTHRFIDSVGDVVEGRDALRNAWSDYFTLFPDFKIHVTDLLVQDEVVVVVGQATGSVNLGAEEPCAWELPAAFKATLKGSLIAEWQVFADNEPVRRLLEEGIDAESAE